MKWNCYGGKMHTLMMLSKLMAFWSPVIFEVKLINPGLYKSLCLFSRNREVRAFINC